MGLMVVQMTATSERIAKIRSRRHSGQFFFFLRVVRNDFPQVKYFGQDRVRVILMDHKGRRWVVEQAVRALGRIDRILAMAVAGWLM